MAKLELPAQDWTAELVSTSADKAAKAAGATTAKMLNVPPSALRRIDGFNVRLATADYAKHVQSIVDSIKANGFYSNKPLAGYAAKEDGEDVIKITDGHTRLLAVEKLIEEGVEIPTVPVVVKPQTQNLEDLTIALIQDNEGRPLSPFERAIVVKRLIGYGVAKPVIATRIGNTERYVDDMILLAGAPAPVRNMVIEGKTTFTEAVKQLRKNPEKAGETLKVAVAKAAERGKTKATAQDIAAAEAEPALVKPKIDTNKRVFRFKSGEVQDRETVKELLLLHPEEKWWTYVDAKDKSQGVKIEKTCEITIIFSREKVPAVTPAKTPAKAKAAKAAPAAPAPVEEAPDPDLDTHDPDLDTPLTAAEQGGIVEDDPDLDTLFGEGTGGDSQKAVAI